MNDMRHRIRGPKTGVENCVAVFSDRRELLTRIESALLRKSMNEPVPPLQIGDLYVCTTRQVATWHGRALDLSPKEFGILAMLARYADQEVSRSFLFDRVWSEEFAGEARLIDRHIMKLRQKLGDGASLIETVPGIGYRLTARPSGSVNRPGGETNGCPYKKR